MTFDNILVYLLEGGGRPGELISTTEALGTMVTYPLIRETTTSKATATVIIFPHFHTN